MINRQDNSTSSGFLVGVITGGVIGAAIAIVLAPRVADLRRRVSTSAADFSDKAAQTCQDVNTRVADAVDGVTAKGQALRDGVADAIAGGARHVEQFAMATKTAPADRRSL